MAPCLLPPCTLAKGNGCKTVHNIETCIQKKWIAFNSSSSGVWDAGDNKLHLPGCKELVDWVSATYRELQTTEQEAVRRSFLVTGLTVAANKSEDHFIENLSMIPKSSGNS
ncbi:hypothetical protein L9F63_003004 [Diploptera punctata]|uniref:Uncharacterized protein n=1 Tax=Diploptera punctata TaxID=6984 RepID=A0AAD7ZRA1_DIPPU|nr:hypothetical protein L9F63_003004 [Diploptera punctata]